jgi:hypothetical protein
MAKKLAQDNLGPQDEVSTDSFVGLNDLNDEKKSEKKLTKKATTIVMLKKDGGATINQIAQAYVDVNGDPDIEKNRRVARLWLSKIGFEVSSRKDEAGVKYYFPAK